jgi:sec-independent protein translocase protein TatA
MGLDNPLHLAFIVVILLLVFGARRLPEIGRSLGSGMREFKDSISGESKPPTLGAGVQQSQVMQPQQPVAAPPVSQPVAAPAAPPQPQPVAAPPQPQPVSAPPVQPQPAAAPPAQPQQPAPEPVAAPPGVPNEQQSNPFGS